MKLWYTQPASKWEEALPLGNGRLGAMVFGGVAEERLQLNEATLVSGYPSYRDLPLDVRKDFPAVTDLIAHRQFAEADGSRPETAGGPLAPLSTVGRPFLRV